MNIESLHEHINYFQQRVVASGFKRDIDDYVSSLPANQNNILGLRDIAGKVLSSIRELYSSDLQDGLAALLPKEKIRPFTETPYNETLDQLIENTEIPQTEFFDQLTQTLSKLQSHVQQNISEIEVIEQFIKPYLSGELECLAEDQCAIVSIIFNDQDTITSLKQFTRTLAVWNRVLPIYHQLIKSDSPEDIQIVEVQNGSIDFIVNLNVDVAVNLADLFTIGFKVFAAYLSYKKMIEPIIDSYHGNKKLIENETEREKLLLENIGTAIHRRIEEQHKKAKKADKNVDDIAIHKKVEQVTKLVTAHIINGNDLKLLALPKTENEEENNDQLEDTKDALREESVIARRQLKNIPAVDRQVLLDTYGKAEADKE